MFNLKSNKNGSSLIVALAVMIVLAAAAVTVVHLSGTDTRSYTDDTQAAQALAVGNAGLQRALQKLNLGEDPTMTNISFAQGQFTVTSDPISSKLIATSRVGNAIKTQTINADFSRNCVNLIVDSSYINGVTLFDVNTTKLCNQGAFLDKLLFQWNWSECACNVNCDGSVDVNDEDNSNEVVYETVGDAGRNKYWICHVPPGNPENQQSIAVNTNGWINGHSAGQGSHNLDYLGPCIISQPSTTPEEEDPVVTCDGTSESSVALGTCEETDGGAHINKVTCSSGTLFEAGSIPSTSSVAMHSGEIIDIQDRLMEQNGTYHYEAIFDQEIPSGSWYYVTAYFLDGSSLSGVVKAGDQPAEGTVDSTYVPPVTDATPGYEIASGVVTVDPNYTVKVDVLGSSITCGAGGPEVYVRTKLCINNTCNSLWSYGDVDGGETYTTTTASLTSYKIQANAYLSSCNNFSATHDSSNTTQVRTLINGEQAPALAGYGGQMSVQQFLAPYLDSTGKVQLDTNQIIMLFELGTTNMSSSAADFQDLVMLLTITH